VWRAGGICAAGVWRAGGICAAGVWRAGVWRAVLGTAARHRDGVLSCWSKKQKLRQLRYQLSVKLLPHAGLILKPPFPFLGSGPTARDTADSAARRVKVADRRAHGAPVRPLTARQPPHLVVRRPAHEAGELVSPPAPNSPPLLHDHSPEPLLGTRPRHTYRAPSTQAA